MPQGQGAWRRRRLAEARLYLCAGCGDAGPRLQRFLEQVLAAGVDIVQLRDKDADPRQLRAASARFAEAARRFGALFVLNDDPALATEVGADGVHVGQDDPPPEAARALVGPDALVGRSTHDAAQVDRALSEDCDYFAVGPVHPTPTKAGRPPVGLDPVRHAARVAGDRPWFVTGGMDATTAPAVLAAGGRRLVVVRALTAAADPAAATAAIVRLLSPPGPAPSP